MILNLLLGWLLKMSNNTELKLAISQRIQAFSHKPFKDAASAFLNQLGYHSEKTFFTTSVEDFCQQLDSENILSHPTAQLEQWQNANFLFQLTDDDIAGNASLFEDKTVRPSFLQSYVFIAIELKKGNYSRTTLAGITRQINRLFPMPVMVIFKIEDTLSLAIINRRINKRDENCDVLGKVTLIQNINIDTPHAGHIDILASFALSELSTNKRRVKNFDQLHAAWEDIFNVELLNKRFYEELSNWYFWARHHVWFPDDLEPDEKTRNATSVIRLLTRLIFCWFLKEKHLISHQLFDEAEIKNILNDMDANSSSYYHAILQNLFFATLNQPMNFGDTEHRKFAIEGAFKENNKQYGVKNLYRHASLFKEPNQAINLFSDIPFLNGGLFSCLDVTDDNGKVQYADGFSRNPKKQPKVPNKLFFSEWHTIDLSGKDDFGDTKKKKSSVRGLLHILNSYKFTITESTPVEQEIALDPELLGNVFENLLASYNPETGESARRQTGSFYTPRAIVEHMTNDTLKAYLVEALCQRVPNTDRVYAQHGLNILFAYTEQGHPFNETECNALIAAIDACNILDPACGSGAYPMGILHKLVFVLGKLDPNNEKWRQRQINKAEEIEDVQARESAISAINNDFNNNALDYGRKLYLIENCIYGVDIQPIAIQIAKLRFFISLICDQRTHNDKRSNLGIRPLPNLETKFVAANSLLGLNLPQNLNLFRNPHIEQLEKTLEKVRHRYFSAQTRQTKLNLQKQDRELVQKIVQLLKEDDFGNEDVYRRIAWNPYDHYSVADFFDPVTMFGPELGEGFDVVIGNPPYVQIQKLIAKQKSDLQAQNYSTYAATGDIYCLFYERGINLLKTGGQLGYITSNKWMRSGYGEKLRKFLAEKTQVVSVMDFGMAQNFGAATTYTSIVHAIKKQPTHPILACYVTDDVAAMNNPSDYFSNNSVERQDFDANPWVLLSAERYRIKKIVESQGIPLEKWGIQINRGILTGYNDAFYITTAQKEALIAEDPRSADLIVPLLRGRYIERFSTAWHRNDDEKWMLFIPWHFPLHLDGTETGASQKAEDMFAEHYPSVYKYLLNHKEKLSQRNQAETGIRYEWYALQRWASDYYSDFKKNKIIYPNMTKYLPFYLDTAEHFFINDKAFILTTKDESLPYLTAVLNSSLFRCCFMDNFPELMGNTYEVRKIFMEKVSIKKPNAVQVALFEALVPLVQAAKAETQKTQQHHYELAADFLTEVINACVMEVYFPQYMAEKRLSMIEQVQLLLPANIPQLNNSELAEAAFGFYKIANASQHPIRNMLLRIPAESPELLAVIQREGAV